MTQCALPKLITTSIILLLKSSILVGLPYGLSLDDTKHLSLGVSLGLDQRWIVLVSVPFIDIFQSRFWSWYRFMKLSSISLGLGLVLDMDKISVLVLIPKKLVSPMSATSSMSI